MPDAITNTALEISDHTIPLFPVSAKKTPVWPKGKAPNGRDGLHQASTDYDEIVALFDHPRVAGIGMPTGKISKITVVDVDCGRGKKQRKAATEWLDDHRQQLLGCKVVRTQSGGLHYYCKYDPEILTGADRFGPGVDCRNDGGYVVIPPFMGYEIVRWSEPEDWPAPPPAAAPAEHTNVVNLHSGATPPQIIEMRDLIEAGTAWHDPVRDIVAHLVGAGWSDAEILKHTFQWTWPGHQPAQTFIELCIMIAGARSKWTRRDAPLTTDQARIDRFASIWDRCSPEAREIITKMVIGANGTRTGSVS